MIQWTKLSELLRFSLPCSKVGITKNQYNWPIIFFSQMRAAENVRSNRQYQVMVSLSKQPIIKSVYKVHQIIDERLQISIISYFIHCKSRAKVCFWHWWGHNPPPYNSYSLHMSFFFNSMFNGHKLHNYDFAVVVSNEVQLLRYCT